MKICSATCACGLLILLMSSQAAAQTLPDQQFDSLASVMPPSGWAMQNNTQPGPGTVTQWFDGNTGVFAPESGAGYIAANFNAGTGTCDISAWLISPPVYVQNGAVLTFYTRTTTAPSFADRLQVRLNSTNTTNVGATAASVGDFTNLMLDINPTYLLTGAGSYPTTWTQFTVTVSGVSGTLIGRLAFRYFVENGGPTGTRSNYIGLDNVVYPGGPNAPEMDVAYPNGGSPIADNGSDSVGSVGYGAPGQTIFYAIFNNGAQPLTLGGAPRVVVSAGTNVSSVSVTVQPNLTIGPLLSSSFDISVTVAAAGAFDFTVSIQNDDPNENLYNWTVSGTGTTPSQPDIDVLRGATSIADGGTDNLGNLAGGVTVPITYTVTNVGTTTLTTGANLAVQSATNCNVTIITQPGVSVAPASSTSFIINLTPGAAGAFSFVLGFNNNDPDEGFYDWTTVGNTGSGGGGGGGGSDSGGCTTNDETAPWLLLVAALVALIASLRVLRRT